MSIFRIKLFTPKKDSIHVGDRDYRLKHNLLAIGWGVKTEEKIPEYEERQQKQYEQEKKDAKLKGQNPPSNSFKASFRNLKKIEIGEYVWTKIDKETYYIGKVTSGLKKDEKSARLGFVRDCIWKKVNFDKVPKEIVKRFIGQGYTLTKMKLGKEFETISNTIYN